MRMDMSAKRLIFRLLICLLSLPIICTASEIDDYSIEQRELRSRSESNGLRHLIPTHAKLQYGGGIGVASIGVGWDYGKRNQWESDILIGYLPESYSDVDRFTFTLRQNYTPWNIEMTDHIAYEPLSCGIYCNTISGNKFWFQEPSKYGGRYYKFTSRVRLHAFVGQRVNFMSEKQRKLQGVSLYYELSLCDLNVIAKITNSKLKMSDILFFSFGLKLQFNKSQ